MTQNRKTQTDDLIAKLQRMIDSMPDEASDNTLTEQNNILNSVFKRMLSDSDERSSTALHRYGLALRAQSQYVRTLDLVKKLEQNDTQQ
jgi:hypothetical protein